MIWLKLGLVVEKKTLLTLSCENRKKKEGGVFPDLRFFLVGDRRLYCRISH